MSGKRYDEIMKTFGQRLKKARQQKFRSARKAAEAFGMDEHRYRKYERGATEPDFEALLQICAALDITTDYLLPLERKPSAKKPTPQRSVA